MPADTPVQPDQVEIVTAIESGAAVDVRRELRRIDTHMSHVFVDLGWVYKLKRSVRHPFADMSSPEMRRLACDAELAVNRDLAGDLYEAVLPVIRNEQGAIKVGGRGEILDWIVLMRRFPDGALLQELAEAGTLTADQVREAVTGIAKFHASRSPCPNAGHAADYRRIILGLRQTEAAGAARLGVRPASEDLFAALDRMTVKVTPLIEARRKAGWVRRGHGDLHLRNICVWQGRVVPFDALEFDASLATTDVIYDVAFLLMDLRARGLNRLCNTAMNTYWEASGQPEEALALLPFFMALRSAVRMAVAVEAGDLVQAAAYRGLGLELLQHDSPRLLAIGGLSGTGKSTLADALAADLAGPCGARVLRTDALRKALAGVSPTARLSGAAYAPEARAAVYDVLAQRAKQVVAAGSSAIADATFQDDNARTVIAGATTGPFIGLWLRAPTTVRLARVAARRNDVSDATPDVARRQQEPAKLGDAWRILNAEQPTRLLLEETHRVLQTASRDHSQPPRP